MNPGPDRTSASIAFVSQHDREVKAKKIEAVLTDALACASIQDMHILDLGCGVGRIAGHFAAHNVVVAADVRDRLEIPRERIRFVLLRSETLPFGDAEFDIVVTNHVIEHVRDQLAHLKEIRRVLKDSGVAYIATPNRYFPMEPHYGVPLIHYLPNGLFHATLRAMRRYRDDVYLLSYRRMRWLFNSSGFQVTEYTGRVLKEPVKFHMERFWPARLPGVFLEATKFFSPTNIFVLRKPV